MNDAAELNLANSLLSVLEEEKRILDDLAAVAAEEQEALVSAEINSMEKILAKKEGVVYRLAGTESKRVKVVRELSNRLGLGEKSTLKQIASRLGGEVAERLVKAGSEVAEATGRADRLNRLNAYLIGTSMQFVDRFLNRLIGWQNPSATYQRKGGLKNRPKSSIFVNREA